MIPVRVNAFQIHRIPIVLSHLSALEFCCGFSTHLPGEKSYHCQQRPAAQEKCVWPSEACRSGRQSCLGKSPAHNDGVSINTIAFFMPFINNVLQSDSHHPFIISVPINTVHQRRFAKYFASSVTSNELSCCQCPSTPFINRVHQSTSHQQWRTTNFHNISAHQHCSSTVFIQLLCVNSTYQCLFVLTLLINTVHQQCLSKNISLTAPTNTY